VSAGENAALYLSRYCFILEALFDLNRRLAALTIKVRGVSATFEIFIGIKLFVRITQYLQKISII